MKFLGQGWGFVLDSTEELEALPKLPSWIFELLSSGEGRKGTEWQGKEGKEAGC